jgi:hypothetical protein
MIIAAVSKYTDLKGKKSGAIVTAASYERFFCCNSCKSEYKKKYGGRIEAIENRHASLNL